LGVPERKQEMKYASEVGVDTSVVKWKPITAEVFASKVHHYAADTSDVNGNDTMLSKSFQLERKTIATIWYIRKFADSAAVYTPRLMTVEYSTRKLVCFEYILSEEEWEEAKNRMQQLGQKVDRIMADEAVIE
jgi:hypothetical protein